MKSKGDNMIELHPNTWKLVRIEIEMVKLGFTEKYPTHCFSYEVARATNELGNEYPSDEAIVLAKRWLDEFKSTGKIEALERL